jgi:hypothetical protein
MPGRARGKPDHRGHTDPRAKVDPRERPPAVRREPPVGSDNLTVTDVELHRNGNADTNEDGGKVSDSASVATCDRSRRSFEYTPSPSRHRIHPQGADVERDCLPGRHNFQTNAIE